MYNNIVSHKITYLVCMLLKSLQMLILEYVSTFYFINSSVTSSSDKDMEHVCLSNARISR